MENKRLIELDVLRGVAAVSVLLFHYTSRYNTIFETSTMNWFEFSFGHYGVQLFFIISGFVIFMTLGRSKNKVDFIKRRFIRLYPTFWISMFITFTITSFSGITRFERTFHDFLINLTMIPNLIGFQAIDGVYWSLEVELLFYFLMIILLQFKLLKFIFEVLIVWLLGGIFINYFKIQYLNVILMTNYSYLFIIGILFFKIWTKKYDINIKYHLLILLCVLYGFAKNIEEGFVALFCVVVFYLFIYDKLTKILNLSFFRWFIFLGNISYPLYLIHQFIGMILIFYLSEFIDNYFILLIIPSLISIVIAWIITNFLEKTIQEYFKKLIF